MFDLVLIISVVVPLVALAFDLRRKSGQQIVLSHFWYFTLIWMAAFPLRGWLVLNYEGVSQVIMTGNAPRLDASMISAALALALAYWISAYAGFRFGTKTRSIGSGGQPLSARRVAVVGYFWVLLAVGVIAYLDLLLSDIDGSRYIHSRMGRGLLWMIPELCVPAFIAFLACVAIRTDLLAKWFLAISILVFAFVSLWVTAELNSRRIFAAILLGSVITLVIRQSRWWPLGGVAVVGSVIGAGLFEAVRYIPSAIRRAEESDACFNCEIPTIKSSIESFFSDSHLHLLSTSFEGAEHVAVLLDKASNWQLWTGIDHGASWLFNLGASFVPRAVWDSKPIIYGGIEQMAWIYPGYVKDGLPTTAIPTSFVVDFAFGFGLPAGLVLAFFLGRYLRVCGEILTSPTAHPAAMGFSLVTFIFMFNIVRGGTAIGQTLVVFAVIAASMVGLRATVRAAWLLLADTFGFPSGTAKPAPCSVFFYPHRYLRDRQLDTIRCWPKSKIANPQLTKNRQGAQVSRSQALAMSRPSWIQRLPLLNLKRRPPEAPAESAVYIWGGLMTSGPFIVDLDNPYAFTGYNVAATRLYRWVVRWFLMRPRCLSIRCLSEACHDGLRELYGDSVAAKAAVVHPVITPKADGPPLGSEGKCRFLFVATQFEIKGGEALLKAFRRVVDIYPGATLDLVTHLPPEFAEEASSCPGVTVHNANFTREQIAERFLAHSDVLVHPTYCDSFGMIVLEAMAFGIPVVATSVYAIPEMVDHGASGVLLDPPVSIWDGHRPGPLFPDTAKVRAVARATDTTAFEERLVEAMLLLARDPQLRRTAGQAGLDRVTEWSDQRNQL